MTERKLTREQQRTRRELDKAFQATLKQQAKQAAWGYIKPTPFKRIGDWFVSLHPMVWTDTERAELWAMVKPYAIDDLMGNILGHGGLNGTSLSLRARGPYCLVRPMFTYSLGAGGDLAEMARASVAFLAETETRAIALKMDDFIAFTADDRPSGLMSDNHVAALILANRPQDALSACEKALTSNDLGSNSRQNADGRIVGFFELARDWLRRNRS